MKFFTWNRLFVLSLVFVAACEQASDTIVGIPSVNIQCESATDPTCSSGSSVQNVFVFMTRSGCGDSATFEPIASGNSSMNCDTQGCTGTVSVWEDVNSNPVTEILTGRMDICSRIDIGADDASESAGDLSNESSENIQSADPILIDSWTEI